MAEASYAQQASAIQYAPVPGSPTSLRISWTNGGGTGGRIVVVRKGGSTWVPSNGTNYTATLAFPADATSGTGPDFDAAGSNVVAAVVYNGSGATNSVDVTGLAGATFYTIQVYEYDAGNAYNLSPAAGNPSVAWFYANSATTTDYMVPAGITSVNVQAWGGGGGGGDYQAGGKGGGGGGAYATGTITVTPGNLYQVTAGAGGAGGTSGSTAGEAGDDSKFASLVIAKGGATAGNSATGGQGGQASACVPTAGAHSGGKGGNAASNAGGGGGGSAFTNNTGGAGNNGSGSNGGSGGNGTGNGGDGGDTTPTSGDPGITPGGGGGGRAGGSATPVSGDGADGLVIVSYVPISFVSATTSSTTLIKVKFNQSLTSIAQANGSQFTISGVTITGAAVDGGDNTVVNLTVNPAITSSFSCTSCLSVATAAVSSSTASNLTVSGQNVTDGIAPGALSTAPATEPVSVGPYINATEEGAGFTVRVPLTGSGAVSGDLVRLLLGGVNFPSAITATLNGTNITDGYKDVTVADNQLGSDGSKSITARIEDAAGNVGGQSPALALTLDTGSPAAATVTVSATANTVVTNYYNSTNTGINVVIPQAAMNDASLEGGTYTIQVNNTNSISGASAVSTASAVTIASGDINADKTVSIDQADIPLFADGATLYFFAVLTDVAGNSTTGNLSTVLTVDTQAPVISSLVSDATGSGTLPINGQITFTLTLSAAEPGATIAPTTGGYNGGDLSWSTSDGGTNYTATYTVQSGQNDQTTALQLTGVTVKDAAGNTSTSSATTNVAKTIDAHVPPAFTTGTLTTTGGTVKSGYWNTSNTGITVSVPIPANVGGQFSLDGGTVKIQGRKGTDAFADITGATATIGSGESGTTISVSLTDTQFESISGFADGETVQLRAVITDVAGNATTGGTSSTDIIIDQFAPNAGTNTTTVASFGGTLKSGYWNGTNTRIDISVQLPNDNSLVNGTVQIQVKNNTTGVYVPISGSPVNGTSLTISTANTTKVISFNASDLEAAFSGGNGFLEGETITYRPTVTDVAGNSTNWSTSLPTQVVDQTPPTVVSSTIDQRGTSRRDRVYIKYSEPLDFADNAATLTGYTPSVAGTIDSYNYETTGYTDGSASSGFVFPAYPFTYLVSTGNTDWNSSTTFTYSTATGNLVDVAGNELANNTSISLTDNVAPSLASGLVFNPDGSNTEKIIFSVNEDLNLANNAAVVGFSVSQGGLGTAIYTAATNTITLTSSANGAWVDDGTLTIAYTQGGSSNVKDLSNNEMASFSGAGSEPILARSVHIQSDNSTNTAFAKTNDDITLTFTTSRAPSTTPAVTIAGLPATTITGSHPNWTAKLVDVPGSTAPGAIAISITIDETGGKSTITTYTTDGSDVTFDITAPTASVPNLDDTDDTGVSTTDNITRYNNANNGSNRLTFTGTAETSSTVRLFDETNTQLGSFTINSGTTWTIDLPAMTLTDGAHQFYTTVTDRAGNATTSSNLDVTIDTQVPGPSLVSSIEVWPAKGQPLSLVNDWSQTNGTDKAAAPGKNLTFRITLSEGVQSLSTNHFNAFTSGALTFGSITTVTPVGTDGKVFDVTVSNAQLPGFPTNSGTGRLGLSFLSKPGPTPVNDIAGNTSTSQIDYNYSPASFTGTGYYTLVHPEPNTTAFGTISTTSTGNSITVSWSSPNTAQTPTHFLVLAKLSSDVSWPADLVNDVKDGNYIPGTSMIQHVTRPAINGTETVSTTFTNLSSGTSYDFIIYKYTLGDATQDNINFEKTAPGTKNGVFTTTASLSALLLNSTPTPISSIIDNSPAGDRASVMQFTLYDDGRNPISPNVMTLQTNGLSQESITFTLRDALTLAEGGAVTGFTSSTGSIVSAIYTGKGTTNTITLTNAGDGTWDANTTISYNAVIGNIQFVTLGKMQPLVAHPVSVPSETVVPFSTPGTQTFTVPAGVTKIQVEVWGAGGGGGGYSVDFPNGSGGGGGGGAYSRSLVSVIPGASYNVTVGAGGAAIPASTAYIYGTAGGSSSFGSSLVVAEGGKAGLPSAFYSFYGTPYQYSTYGYGGSAANGSGDIKFSGGNGGYGVNNLPLTLTTGSGGGGGSSAGNSVDGNTGASGINAPCSCTSAGGGAPSGGGSGGAGTESGNGGDGSFPGGGGGGTGDVSASSGAGATGMVKITYTLPASGGSDWDADNTPFKFSQLVITQGTGNSAALNNWQDIIAGAELTDGTVSVNSIDNPTDVTINTNNITFSNIPSSSAPNLGYITDASGSESSKTYTLKVWLKSSLGTLASSVDGLNLAFKVDPANLTYDDTSNGNLKSSRLVSTQPALESGAEQIQVVATKLVFNQNMPATIGVNRPFIAPKPVIEARDENNNRDLNFTGHTVALSNTGMTYSGVDNFSSGILTLNNFFFNDPGLTTVTFSGTGITTDAAASIEAIISDFTTITPSGAAPAEIASTVNAAPPVVIPAQQINFQFTVKDDDAAPTLEDDVLPTRIGAVTIRRNTANGTGSGSAAENTAFDDWTQSIQGARLSVGNTAVSATVNIFADRIEFTNIPNTVSGDLGYIADNGSRTYTLSIWLKNSGVSTALQDFIDNEDFVFAISGATDVGLTSVAGAYSSTLSSSINYSTLNSGDGNNKVDVDATKLDFITQWLANAAQSYDAPLDADAGTVGVQSPTAKARDANGYLDKDWSTANGKSVTVATTTPATWPLANSTVTLTNGIVTFNPGLQVTSAGNGANGASTNLIISSTGLTNGSSNSFTLNYSNNSDIIRETTFAYPTNIDYAATSNQVTDITTTTGTILDRYKIRDGGGTTDADGTATVLSSITLRVTNWQYLRKLALYNVGSSIISPGTEITNGEVDVAAAATGITGTQVAGVWQPGSTADITFSGLTGFSATDGGQNNFEIRASFKDINVIDNEVISFQVISVATASVSSAFSDTTPDALASAVTGDQNKIEVTATSLDITSPSAASFVSINTPFAFTVQARDANNNLDKDFTGASGAIREITAANGVTVANAPTGSFTNGVLTVNTAQNFMFTTGGDNNEVVTLTVKAGGTSGTTCGANGVICTSSTGGTSPALTLKTTTLTAGALTEPGTISSISSGVNVFDFTINDDDNVSSGTDALPTKVTAIKITKLAGENDIGDWRDLIQSATLTSGSFSVSATVGAGVNQNDITFTGIPAAATSDLGYIADNTSKTYTLNIVLKTALGGSLPSTVDNLNIAFEVLAANITPDVGGGPVNTSSTLSTSEKENSGTGTNAIDVDATKLKWTTNPTGGNPAGSLLVNKDISAQNPIPVIEAMDANNNRDLDYTTNLNITNNKSLPMSAGAHNGVLAQNSVTTLVLGVNSTAPQSGGIYTFPGDFQYDGIDATAGNGTMTAVPATTGTTVVNHTDQVSTVVTVRVGIGGTLTAGALTEPATISSLIDNDGAVTNPATGGVDVFDFVVNDETGATPATENDGNPTRIQSIRISQGTSNTIGRWSDAIAFAKLSDDEGNSVFGTVGDTYIDFGAGGTLPNANDGETGYINDNGSKTYTLKIWLKENLGGSLPATIDGLQFDFEVLASNVGTNANGSSIIGTEKESSGNKNEVTVIATQIDFTTVPTGASISVALPSVIVSARDVNKNTDLDYTGDITAIGTTPGLPDFGTINNPVTTTDNPTSPDHFINGVYTYPANFQFDTGDGDVQLTINAGPSAPASAISGTSPVIHLISSFESVLKSDYLNSGVADIPYISYQNNDITNKDEGYQLDYLRLNDGGIDLTDVDGAPTVLNNLTLGLSNPQSIRKIAVYAHNHTTDVYTEIQEKANADITVTDGYGQVTFSGLNITAADNDYTGVVVLATFNNLVSNIQDRDTIQVSVLAATVGTGSKFAPDASETNSIGGLVKSNLAFPPAATTIQAGSIGRNNKMQAVATSLDFVTQASGYAGTNEPIGASYTTAPLPATSAAIVHARDKFGILDTDFEYTATVSGAVNAPITSFTSNFDNGILDLDGMTYSSTGNGALKIVSNGIDSSNPNPATNTEGNSIPGQTVNVVHVRAAAAAIVTPPNLKGGTQGATLLGVTFTADFSTTSEPSLKKFIFSFDAPYKTNSTVTFKNFKVRLGATDVTTMGAIVSEESSTGSPTDKDLVTVDWGTNTPIPLYDPSTGAPVSKTFYLVADVDISAKIGTPNLTPQLIDEGYSRSTDKNIITTKGTATANVIGQKYSFASTRPPVLKTDITSLTNPYNGQLNVDKGLLKIDLEFDVQVWSLDGVAELYDRETNTKVADLIAINGNYKNAEPTTNPISFSISWINDPVSGNPYAFEDDKLYYVTIKKGSFDNLANNGAGAGTGISDDGFNYFGGISSNAILFFKISSPNPPVLAEAKSNFNNLTTGTFQTNFDQRGTAYFLVVNAGSPAPTNADIFDPTAYGTSHPGTVITNGSYPITQVNTMQTVTYNASLSAGATYDIWIYAKNDAQPVNISTTAPYGSYDNLATPETTDHHVVGAAGPTLKFTLPTAGNTRVSYQPDYAICPNSFYTLSDPIILGEQANGDFKVAGTQDFNILLPTGFLFDGINKPDVQLIGSDFDQTSLNVTWVNNTIINISYKNETNGSLDKIIITNLRIKGDLGSAPDAIKRFAGSASLGGISILASVSTLNPAEQKFTNSYSVNNDFTPYGFPGNAVVTAIPDNYIDQDASITGGIRLLPQITPVNDYGVTFFTGNGVTNDVLSLSAVAKNSAFDITMAHTDLNGCISENRVQYVVYDHTSPISTKLGTAENGTQEPLYNTNFPNPANVLVIPNTTSPRINYKDLAGYKLLLLKADTIANPGDQIIKGADWQAQVAKIPVSVNGITNDPDLPASLGFTAYNEYQWDYSHILNAATESKTDNPATTIVKDPYDEFKFSTVNNAPYWKGGSLGKIAFTGTFHNTADLTVVVPFRQEVELFVPPIPVVEVDQSNQPVKGVPIYCEYGGAIVINGYPAAAAGTSVGNFTLSSPDGGTIINYPGPGFVDNGNGTATLYPRRLDPNDPTKEVGITNEYKDIQINYTFQENNSPAFGTGSIIIRITPNPVADFTTDLLCEDRNIHFSDVSPPINVPGISITKWNWNFADANSASNTSTDPNPTHNYEQPGLYPNVQLNVTTNFGCSSVIPKSDDLNIGGTPQVNFNFAGISTADDISFTSVSSVSSNDKFKKLTWTFGDGGTAEETYTNQPTNPATVFTNQYADPDIYQVKLEVTSEIGCSNSITKPIIVLDRKESTADAAYDEHFENGTGNWIPSSLPNKANVTNSYSWAVGHPAASVIKAEPSVTGDKVWKTSLSGSYSQNERSFLYSPSFDISDLARPMISFHSFAQIETGDGVVLEYSIDDKNVADSTKQWFRLGNMGEGVDWFTNQNIPSKPGKQQSLDQGWSGDNILRWMESKHALVDESDKAPIVGATRVVFRFALAVLPNSIAQKDGFAIDNIRIGNRTRIVLLESFRNLGNSQLSSAPDAGGRTVEKYEADQLAAFNPSGTDSSLVKINYHLGFPAKDPFNEDNAQDPGARALYYNISKTPRVEMDGVMREDALFSAWASDQYSLASLKLADAKIRARITKNSDNSVGINIDVTALKDLGPKTILQVVVVEKEVPLSGLRTDMQSLVKTGESNFSYVVKKLLPNAAGTRFGTTLPNGTSRTFPDNNSQFIFDRTVPLYASDQLAVVAFLQDEDTKEVFQTEIFDLEAPGVVTDVEETPETHFNVYPNPADREMTVELPEAATEATPLQVFDQMGKVVYESTFEKGDKQKAISTDDYAAGVYLIQIRSEKGMLRRKVMVVHHN